MTWGGSPHLSCKRHQIACRGWLRWVSDPSVFLVVFMVSWNPFVLQSTETAMVLSVIGTRGVYSPSIIRCSVSVILAGKAMEKIVQVKCKLWLKLQ